MNAQIRPSLRQAIALLAAVALRAGAATVSVTDFAELQSAVANASDGDEIVLAAGTYAMNSALSIAVPHLTVRGATGNRDDVVLNVNGGGYKITLNAAGIVVRDLTFANGKATSKYGAAFNATLSGTGSTIENVRVTGCLVTGDGGAFILADNNCRLTVRDCVVDGNAGDTTGYTLGLFGSHRYGKPPAGIYVQGAGSVIANCAVTNIHYVGRYDGSLSLGIFSL